MRGVRRLTAERPERTCRVAGNRRRPGDVGRVLVVLVADVFHQLFTRREPGGERHGEGLRVRAGIVNRDLVDQRPEIPARVALDDVEALGVGMSLEVEPELAVEADGVDDKRAALEAAD